jgi:predicted ATPase
MPALLEIRATNYRSLEDVSVQLQELNVLVGPNGAGKSNLLDLISFVGDSVRTDLMPAIDKRGGFDRVCFRGETDEIRVIKLGVTTNVTSYSSKKAPDVYDLEIWQPDLPNRNDPRQILLRTEKFKFKRTQKQGRRITIDGAQVDFIDEREGVTESEESSELLREDSLGLATLPRLSDEKGGRQVRQIAELFSSFRVFDVDVAAARLPTPLSADGRLASDARNLAGFLLTLSRDKGRFAQLLDDARAFVPGLADLVFVEAGGAEQGVALELEEQHLPGRTALADASYGTVRALALLALLYDPEPPKLTCVEEIDRGLHPYVFDRLVDRLREESKRSQFIVTTHSPALVNRLRPRELIVCERSTETGGSLIPAITPNEAERIAEASDGLGLGELWFSGTLGGVLG